VALSQEEFLRELMADFKIEAAEHLQAISNGLLLLEKHPDKDENKKIVETVFREFHSLKGASRAVNLLDIERLCQSLEGVFHQLKEGKLTFSPLLFELLFKGVEVLGHLLNMPDGAPQKFHSTNLSQLIKTIDNHVNNTIISYLAPTSEPLLPIPQQETEQAEDQNSTSIVASSHEPSQPEIQTHKETVRIPAAKLNDLLRQAEELINTKTSIAFFIEQISNLNNPELQPLQHELNRFHHSFSRMSDDLIYGLKSTLFSPFSSLTDIVPMIVRDLGKEFGKEIDFQLSGAETEIDRRILEELKEPVIHLIRNCIDHGIEKPEVRIAKGKQPRGTISIHISQESGRRIVLELQDDGAGIDRVRLRESVLKNSVLSTHALDQLTDQEFLYLIFRSGITTSPIITDLSGRGLGMAIVASKVDGLGGSISVESAAEKGTRFVFSLPLTLSTFRGVVVKANNQLFVIPTSAVEKAIRIGTNNILFAESKPFISIQGENIALVKLADALQFPAVKQNQSGDKIVPAVIVTSGHRKICFVVEEIMEEQEGVVKSLGPQLIHVRNIAGATVLGNGQVIPILHIPELMESALGAQSSAYTWNQQSNQEDEIVKPISILMAEDSITSRMLIRNILETAGYQVKAAVDGLEAFQILQNNDFDLVVSDVEMPNMNGFELTAKIRSDQRFSSLPVILITALSSDIDKQRGLEAGANAYIVKSNFEQSNLVETIRRLV
jgi:two-component system chemotaxis sensor kinase CheA